MWTVPYPIPGVRGTGTLIQSHKSIMPRQARTISATNIYHAILRGVNKQQVFEDDEDYIRFLNVLRRQTQPDVDAQGQTFQPRCHV